MIITYAFMFAAVALGTASNIFAKEAEGFTKLFQPDILMQHLLDYVSLQQQS